MSTAFDYMNARYYEPSGARFLTPDSYTGNPYNPNTQNVYSYTGGNPVNYVDPTGHFAIPVVPVLLFLLAIGVVGIAYYSMNPVVDVPPINIDLGRWINVNTADDSSPETDQKDTEDNRPVIKDDAGHIFRDAEGHLPDTPENRELLRDVGSNEENYLGQDAHGNDWYAETQSDGTQVWVQERNGQIINGGLN